MPRVLGGNTSLGQQVNKVNSSTDFTKTRQAPEPKIGVIKKILEVGGDPQYHVILTFFDKVTGKPQDSTPIPLLDHPAAIATLYGSPKDLVGNYYCIVKFTGTNTNRGTAQIIRPVNADTEDTTRWNELAIQGSAFAAPGSGFG